MLSGDAKCRGREPDYPRWLCYSRTEVVIGIHIQEAAREGAHVATVQTRRRFSSFDLRQSKRASGVADAPGRPACRLPASCLQQIHRVFEKLCFNLPPPTPFSRSHFVVIPPPSFFHNFERRPSAKQLVGEDGTDATGLIVFLFDCCLCINKI